MAPPAAHLAPHLCYICGGGPHADTTASGGHRFWSNAEARAEFRRPDRQKSVGYPAGETTPEAAYVAEHRPY